jgi:hypothetical protein
MIPVARKGDVSRVRRIAILCAAVLALSAGDGRAKELDPDPLRAFLPRDDLFMQVPGGVLAVEDSAAPDAAIEERAQARNGGLIVGFCLRSSCTRVTHLAVLQVCGNRTGGPGGGNQLILGLVRLPYGETPGYLKALWGRDYAVNFSQYGPYEETLFDRGLQQSNSLFALSAIGMGPVAPLEFLGLSIKRDQGGATVAVRMRMVRDRVSGVARPRFEVRHLCRRHVS